MFAIEVLVCACGERRRVLSVIKDERVARRTTSSAGARACSAWRRSSSPLPFVPCTEVGDKVVCTRVGFDVLLDAYAELEHRAAVAETDAKAEGKKIEAAHERVAALEAELAKPALITWQPIAVDAVMEAR